MGLAGAGRGECGQLYGILKGLVFKKKRKKIFLEILCGRQGVPCDSEAGLGPGKGDQVFRSKAKGHRGAQSSWGSVRLACVWR